MFSWAAAAPTAKLVVGFESTCNTEFTACGKRTLLLKERSAAVLESWKGLRAPSEPSDWRTTLCYSSVHAVYVVRVNIYLQEAPATMPHQGT